IRLMDKKLVVISPRWTKMCEWATLWLAPKAGTEETLVAGIARAIMDAGLVEQAFLDSRTENGADYLASLKSDALSLESVSKATGVPAGDIIAAAYLYASGGMDVRPRDLPRTTHPSNLPTAKTITSSIDISGDMPPETEGHLVKKPDAGYPPSTIIFSASGPYTLTKETVAQLTNLALIMGNIGR